MAASLFPGEDLEDPEVLGRAWFLAEHLSERLKAAVQNAIVAALRTRR